MFAHLSADEPTTFFDPTCGLPLFRAPVGRSLADFKNDTTVNGWPSFRDAEVVVANVRVDATTGHVYSACGTHVGDYAPDAAGSRYCIDLVCISGNPAVSL